MQEYNVALGNKSKGRLIVRQGKNVASLKEKVPGGPRGALLQVVGAFTQLASQTATSGELCQKQYPTHAEYGENVTLLKILSRRVAPSDTQSGYAPDRRVRTVAIKINVCDMKKKRRG